MGIRQEQKPGRTFAGRAQGEGGGRRLGTLSTDCASGQPGPAARASSPTDRAISHLLLQNHTLGSLSLRGLGTGVAFLQRETVRMVFVL